MYNCTYKDKQLAAKKLQQVTEESFDEFSKEVSLMSKLQHPNLVNLVGFCTFPFVILLELVNHGELYNFLHEPSLYSSLDWRMRTRIVIDIARGMSFLHSLNPPVIHRDLKSPNVLLTSLSIPSPDHLETPIAKISDFGLSTHLVAKMKQSTAKRDVQMPTWLAPEVLRAEGYGEKSDCYALGIIMWELLSPGEHPFDEFGFNAFILKQEKAIIAGVRLSIPEKYRHLMCTTDPNLEVSEEKSLQAEYLNIMTSCWSPKPTDRPSFLHVLFNLTRCYKICYPETLKYNRL